MDHGAHAGELKNGCLGIPTKLNILLTNPQSAYIIHHIMHAIDIEMTVGRKKVRRKKVFNLFVFCNKTAANKAINVCIKVKIRAKITVIFTDLRAIESEIKNL
jgi:hypothetical protein